MPSISLSPPPSALTGANREASGSASPNHIVGSTTEQPKRKHNLTATELQALQLQKLLANPDREVKIPKPAKEKELRAPRETIKNVSGSSAGAGSGEFHVYKHSRRREYERIKLMEEKDRKEKEREAYEAKQRALEEQVSAKTNKNRAKRDKKKQAKLAAKGINVKDDAAEDRGSGQNEEDADEEQGQKRKRINAEGTAQIVFRKKDDEDSGEE